MPVNHYQCPNCGIVEATSTVCPACGSPDLELQFLVPRGSISQATKNVGSMVSEFLSQRGLSDTPGSSRLLNRSDPQFNPQTIQNPSTVKETLGKLPTGSSTFDHLKSLPKLSTVTKRINHKDGEK